MTLDEVIADERYARDQLERIKAVRFRLGTRRSEEGITPELCKMVLRMAAELKAAKSRSR